MTRAKHISHSRIYTFQSCRQKYYYKYIENLHPKIDQPAPRLGKLVDVGISEYLVSQEPPDVSITKYVKDKSAEQTVIATRIAFRALEYIVYLRTLGYETLQLEGKPAVQLELNRNYFGDKYIGFIDWVVKNPLTNTNWIIDFKVREKYVAEDHLEFDYQLPMYQHMFENQYGITISGVGQLQIRNKVPEPPKVLKNGKGLSVSKNQKCDWETYKQYIPKGQEAKYAMMEEKLPKFQKLTLRPIEPRTLQRIWANVSNVATEINKFHRDPRSLRVWNSTVCTRCDYQELCIGEMNGYDINSIREGFEVKK